MVKSVFQPELKLIRGQYKGNRPRDDQLEAMYMEAVSILELMRRNDPALDHTLGSDPREERAAKFRGEQGGHLLFRPMGLQAFSGALGLLRMRGVDTERAIRSLCRVPMQVTTVPWRHVVWNPNTRRIVNGNRAISEALFLHMLGHSPRSARYDLETRYQELLGNPSPNQFKQIPVYGLE